MKPGAAGTKFHLSRYLPSDDLSDFVDLYWTVEWDLRGKAPHVQETIPYPCVNLVFEPGNTRVWGVARGRFARLLEGKGRVFSVKFRPGAFRPFIKSPVSRFTDGTIGFRQAFGADEKPLEDALFSLENEAAMVEVVEGFLRERLPERDDTIELVNRVIACVAGERTMTRVEDLARGFELAKRALQRIFREYVGVSPKWVIKRYRLHEAAEQLAHGNAVDLANLAVELSYFDQAHFNNDFKALVGQTPVEYASACAASSEAALGDSASGGRGGQGRGRGRLGPVFPEVGK